MSIYTRLAGYSGEDEFNELLSYIQRGQAQEAATFLKNMDPEAIDGMNAQFHDGTKESKVLLNQLKAEMQRNPGMWDEVAERIDVPNMYGYDNQGNFKFHKDIPEGQSEWDDEDDY